jgi:hypothetical protein
MRSCTTSTNRYTLKLKKRNPHLMDGKEKKKIEKKELYSEA